MHTFVRRVAGAAVVALVIATAGACGGPADSSPAPSGTTAASSPGPVTVYLTRHGQTMLNVLGRAQGWADTPLTTEGRAQAEGLGKGLASSGVDFEAAYSADMVRHFETASLALSAMGSTLAPERDAGLREISFGAYEGASDPDLWATILGAAGYDDMDTMLKEMSVVDVFDKARPALSGKGIDAEGGTAVGERATKVLERVAAEQGKAGGGEVFVVSSGVTILLVLTQLGVDPASVSGGIHNGAVSQLRYEDGKLSIVSVNDESFIEQGEAA